MLSLAASPYQMDNAPMAEYDERLALFDLADRKGYNVATARMPEHVWLIDPDGLLVVRESGSGCLELSKIKAAGSQ